MNEQSSTLLSSRSLSFLVWWLGKHWLWKSEISKIFSTSLPASHMWQETFATATAVHQMIDGDTIHFRGTNLTHDNQAYFLTDSLQAISISTKDVSWTSDKWEEERTYRFIPSCSYISHSRLMTYLNKQRLCNRSITALYYWAAK